MYVPLTVGFLLIEGSRYTSTGYWHEVTVGHWGYGNSHRQLILLTEIDAIASGRYIVDVSVSFTGL